MPFRKGLASGPSGRLLRRGTGHACLLRRGSPPRQLIVVGASRMPCSAGAARRGLKSGRAASFRSAHLCVPSQAGVRAGTGLAGATPVVTVIRRALAHPVRRSGQGRLHLLARRSTIRRRLAGPFGGQLVRVRTARGRGLVLCVPSQASLPRATGLAGSIAGADCNFSDHLGMGRAQIVVGALWETNGFLISTRLNVTIGKFRKATSWQRSVSTSVAAFSSAIGSGDNAQWMVERVWVSILSLEDDVLVLAQANVGVPTVLTNPIIMII